MLDGFADHAFIDHYDVRGRLLDEPDDDTPQLRRHCSRCGAFLPKQPKTVSRMVPTDWNYTYDEDGEVSGVVVHREQEEIDDVWTCKKCQRVHDSEDMYS